MNKEAMNKKAKWMLFLPWKSIQNPTSLLKSRSPALDDPVQLKLLTFHIWETYSKEYPNWKVHGSHLLKYRYKTIVGLTALKGFAQGSQVQSVMALPWTETSLLPLPETALLLLSDNTAVGRLILTACFRCLGCLVRMREHKRQPCLYLYILFLFFSFLLHAWFSR